MDLPDEIDIEGLEYPPMFVLDVANERRNPSQNKTKCNLEVNGFTRMVVLNIKLELLGFQKIRLNSLSRDRNDSEGNVIYTVFLNYIAFVFDSLIIVVDFTLKSSYTNVVNLLSNIFSC